MNIMITLLAISAMSQPNPESIRNLVPEINYQVHQYDAKLSKQFGDGGGDVLKMKENAIFVRYDLQRMTLELSSVFCSDRSSALTCG